MCSFATLLIDNRPWTRNVTFPSSRLLSCKWETVELQHENTSIMRSPLTRVSFTFHFKINCHIGLLIKDKLGDKYDIPPIYLVPCEEKEVEILLNNFT